MINSKKIKLRMKELGLVQRDVAEQLKIAAPTASQKINGLRPMDLDEARELAILLKIGDDEFGKYFFV